MKKNKVLIVDLAIISVFYVLFLLVQAHAIGRAVFPFTDEGVYLYASKLIAQGYVPYRDFFLGHFPFLIYANALILLVTKSNMIIYHWIYTAWTVSVIIPIYFTIKKISGNRLAAILALVLFCTFVELNQWDMHFFAIRQASLPFLAWGFFFLAYRKLNLTALMLALFSICLATNIIIAAALILSFLFFEFIFNRNKFKLRELISPFLIFIILVGLQFLLLKLITNGVENVLGFQTGRGSVSFLSRCASIIEFLPKNWPIFVFGLAGIFAVNKNTIYLSAYNLLAILAILLMGNSFYVQYLVVLGVGFTISAGILFGRILQWEKSMIYALSILVVFCAGFTSYKLLNDDLIQSSTPDFFAAVGVLENVSGPVMAYEPIYVLYANKEMTFHYDVSDMRHLRVLGENLPESEYLSLLAKSNSVLMEPSLASVLPLAANLYIQNNFKETYTNGTETVLVRVVKP